MKSRILYYVMIATFLLNCKGDSNKLFDSLRPEQTGIDFINKLEFDQEFNIYTYRNYYNGGGVSIGDINNDGLQDIYFTANLGSNKLYLNKGNFRFEDITGRAGVGGSKAWSTGVTMADVNADGLLDIYVCNSGDIKGDNKQNELFINNGDLTFTEEAGKYNLDDRGFSTHASFFDYDRDGDLDVYLLNNSYQSIGSFNLKKNERPKRDSLGGDKLLRNNGLLFEDVSESAGIYGSVIGFGLGVTIGDVNGDAWDDIYVSNDFFERDYLYINQQDGTFKEDLINQMNSISGASMGADMADVNNDGHNDLFVTEMLPKDYQRLKTVTTFEDWNKYQYNVENDYYHQFTRNTFQLNNGDSTFSEVGRISGVEATDWSWGALIFDMDNDGLRDIFVANGIYQDLTNQDYLQYVSNEEVIKSIVTNQGVDYKRLTEVIPSNPIPNHAFKNMGSLQFEDRTEEFGLGTPGFSNGSAYGDLDNDGDLDLVVNNVNGPAFVYRNNTDRLTDRNYLKLVLRGSEKNPFAVGAKIVVAVGDEKYYVEQQPARGFQSSMDFRPNIGLKTSDPVSITVTWPDGRVSKKENIEVNEMVEINYEESIETGDPITSGINLFRKINAENKWIHQENIFIDFHRDRLHYHMNSTEGPKLALGDINGDGQDDIFLGGAKNYPGQILLKKGKSFQRSLQNPFDTHTISEDLGSLFFDADNDGDKDLYVCSGGVEFSQSSSALLDRLYFNDGKGNFPTSRSVSFSLSGFSSTSTVSSADIDLDGDLDLFVGERAKPLYYGVPCDGFILRNDGSGNFENVTMEVAPQLQKIGMITASQFADLDNDGDDDLVITGEYMDVVIFENVNGELKRLEQEFNMKGWWKTLHVMDLDGDGDVDIMAGNHGLNSRFKASQEKPIKLFIYDFDQNGSLDPILAGYQDQERLLPFALRHNLIDQIKGLKKKFPNYESFKNASMEDIFGKQLLDSALQLEANMLASGYFINNGGLNFTFERFPTEAQLYPIYAINSADFDHDGDEDLLMGGNLYAVKPEVGRYDAGYGTYLENDGGKLTARNTGFKVRGEIRDIQITGGLVVVARNNDSLVLFEY